jgi:hypothetical protein
VCHPSERRLQKPAPIEFDAMSHEPSPAALLKSLFGEPVLPKKSAKAIFVPCGSRQACGAEAT